MTKIVKGNYKNQDAVILESEEARAIILPRWGAKLASFIHKPTGAEALWQNPGSLYRETGYGDPYGNAEWSGADEMFPTISRCFYETEPWAGIEVPDHGEVWTLPWEQEITGGTLRMKVTGLRFPYTLEKEVSLEGNRLLSRYRATNPSDFPFDFIWSAHPLFNAVEGMEFIVPSGMDRIINAVPGPALPTYGESLAFPEARPGGGAVLRLDRMPPKNGRDYQKYWFAEKVSEGWCVLHAPVSGVSVGMSWPKEKVPYLGMWLNQGGWEGQYNIAPEPATAAMDRIDFSKMFGMGSCLAPKSSQEWHLSIALSQGKRPKGMGESGDFLY